MAVSAAVQAAWSLADPRVTPACCAKYSMPKIWLPPRAASMACWVEALITPAAKLPTPEKGVPGPRKGLPLLSKPRNRPARSAAVGNRPAVSPKRSCRLRPTAAFSSWIWRATWSIAASLAAGLKLPASPKAEGWPPATERLRYSTLPTGHAPAVSRLDDRVTVPPATALPAPASAWL